MCVKLVLLQLSKDEKETYSHLPYTKTQDIVKIHAYVKQNLKRVWAII